MSRSTTYCSVPQCCNYAKEGLNFHLFPKDPALKSRWETALRMGKSASSHMRVCSEHFLPSDYFPGEKKRRQLKIGVIPSQKRPVRTHDVVKNPNTTTKRQERVNKRNSNKSMTAVSSVAGQDDILNDGNENDIVENHTELRNENHVNVTETLNDNGGAPIVCDKSTMVDPQCLKLTAGPAEKTCVMLQIMTDKTVLYRYTGLHSFERLDGLVECVRDLEQEVLQGKEKQLSVKERIVLTFVKIKLNLYFTTMAPLFGVTRQTCSKYFQDMVPKLRIVSETVVAFPDLEASKNNMPLCFSNYKSTRVVIDCAETPVECCKCIKCRILTYSHYKKRNTLKFLVGVAPSGMIIFMSESYGGRASDKQVTNESGILDKVEFRGAVMADKGFNVKNECHERNIILYQPPFLTKKRKQFSKEEALRTARIAKARVHVERAIQRLREFDFLTQELEWRLAPIFDDVLIIAAGIVNLSAPILNVDKF